MIKKQQKWIALLVICTFVWLMQVSTMPAAAAGTSEQVSSAGAEQGPDYYEAIAQKAAPAKKKSILPWILIGVGVIAVSAALYFFVLKPNYDIRGTWSVTSTWTGQPQAAPFTLVFTGSSKEAGTFKENGNWTGTYTADGKTFTFKYDVFPISAAGEFTDKDTIEGTTLLLPATTGTFKATRTAAATGSGNSAPFGTAKEIK